MSSDDDRLMHPWGHVAPGFWDTGQQIGSVPHVRNSSAEPLALPSTAPRPPAATPAQVQPDGQRTAATSIPGPPQEYAARVATVLRAVENKGDAAGLAAAGVEAETLDQEITAQFGEIHSHTVSIREVRGWLALESQQPETAVRWYLHTTSLQVRLWPAGHEFIVRSAKQAVYAWSVVTAPEHSRVLGAEVLAMLRHTLGEDHTLTRRVRRHMERQAAAGQRPVPGADRPADGGS